MQTTSTSTTLSARRADQLTERATIGTVDQLYAAAFNRPRDPRSAEYQSGVRAALAFRINALPIRRPHAAGTAQDDAFHAGIDEGYAIWRKAQAAAGAA